MASSAIVPTQEHLDGIVLEYLRKKGYSHTEQMLRMESNRTLTIKEFTAAGGPSAKVDDVDAYARTYEMLRDWIETSLDLYKPELRSVLFPLFVHCYLDLVAKKHTEAGK